MRGAQGTLGPSHKVLPTAQKGVLRSLWYCACVVPTTRSRGTAIRTTIPSFYVSPARLSSFILTLLVCLTVMAERSKALVGPGSQLVVAKIIFSFFFLFLLFYCGF